MDYQVIWAESAIQDLREVCSFISKDNPQAALQVGETILEHVKVLASFPLIGPAFPRRSEGNVREIVCLKYRVFYSVVDATKTVEVLRVWHGARGEPPKLV